MIGAIMLKGFTHARLACGCRITFRDGVEGSPVTVVIDEKSPGCTLTLHVLDLRSEQEWIDWVKNRYERLLMELFE